jgi:hypothetical protein
MKKQIQNITANPVGSAVGAVGGWMVATRVLKSENIWIKLASAVVGGVVGAMVQSNIKAKKGVPTATVVAK